eukprot:3412442-Prymnesium_polylepis.1
MGYGCPRVWAVVAARVHMGYGWPRVWTKYSCPRVRAPDPVPRACVGSPVTSHGGSLTHEKKSPLNQRSSSRSSGTSGGAGGVGGADAGTGAAG